MFIAIVEKGKISLGSDLNRERVRQWCAKNEGARLELRPVLPESRKLRGWVEGGVLPLAVFYQEGMDHRNSADIEKMRGWLKCEFNGEMITVGGRTQRVGLSTKGREPLKRWAERVVDWLIDNYQPPQEALDTSKFKRWREAIFPSGGADNYIDYLVELGILKKGDRM